LANDLALFIKFHYSRQNVHVLEWLYMVHCISHV